MGRKIPVFVKGGAPKNNTHTSHGILVFSYKENPTEFFCIDCLVPGNHLMQGFSNFFVLQPFSRCFQISATLACYKL
jgi:hypothetical protein